MILQVTLTVAEGKRIIARAAASLPETRKALKEGKILLKGGTTVSALAEELMGSSLGICGRVSPLGAKGPKAPALGAPHCILIEKGQVKDVDDTLEREVLRLEKDDVFVIGANAIDVHGNAAMMAGSPLGGPPGRVLGGLSAEGINVLILAGLEKLIPTNISDAVRACGRKRIDLAFGMAVGLIPLIGRLITEQTALEILADVKCTVIGRGGICGAEGATTMVVEGKKSAVKEIFKHVEEVKGASTSGAPESLTECTQGGIGCREDLGCIYKTPVKPSFWGDGNA